MNNYYVEWNRNVLSIGQISSNNKFTFVFYNPLSHIPVEYKYSSGHLSQLGRLIPLSDFLEELLKLPFKADDDFRVGDILLDGG